MIMRFGTPEQQQRFLAPMLRSEEIWTSGAHYPQFGLLLARTDPQAERHAGLTCFLLPMDRPGIEVRPTRQIDGERKFNEVFLDDVRIDRSELLGIVGEGRAGSDPRMSILKLVACELHQDVAALLGTRGATIAGGTSETQHNIIAERALGLPRS